MAVIILKEAKENPLELEPYYTFNSKLADKLEDGLAGSCIKVDVASDNHEDGFVNGFEFDRNYGKDIVLKFSFSKNPNSHFEEESYLIHHTIEFECNEYVYSVNRDSLYEIEKRAKYFYLEGTSYFEYSYRTTSSKIEIIFDALTSEAKIRSVCNQLISLDIAIYSRGW